ncbi:MULTISPECIES: GYDIA family GHMP kinase [Winogradskyella]|uniref:GYDIA family GHMP kinase n=1 Tax=Winogradskyella TaxID=286104 RepID=UPI0015CEB887|nr:MULTISPECIES: GYDIA family GHMP kinase [Winogradskyella]QXP77644.1 GHMP kinase [Winogradskyella sp. HaHa_3_26]
MNSHSHTYRSNGKLLLTAEYAVLDGAKALAIPTKYGQSLTVENNTTNIIYWKSYNELNEVWFEDEFLIENDSDILCIIAKVNNDVSERLIQILKAIRDMNPDFLASGEGYNITTHQDFNRAWGLGTSSTLINNMADWANVNAYQLLQKTFGGSGYDIACAQNDTPITFKLKSKTNPVVDVVKFQPKFIDQLYFVYLNQKQNSRDGISTYKKLGKVNTDTINDINAITETMISCTSLTEFESLIENHETIISKLIQHESIKSRLFSDFKGAVKSLGAWGGDFVMVTSEKNPTSYFNDRGYDTVISYKEMVL